MSAFAPRILRLAALLYPTAQRELLHGMAAEYHWLESSRERRRFLLGALLAVARIATRSWTRDAATWLGVALCGVTLPLLDHHHNQPCLLIPAALLVPLVFSYESPRAYWRWPLGFMLTLAAGAQLSPLTGYIDRPDLFSLLLHTLPAAWLGTFLRRRIPRDRLA